MSDSNHYKLLGVSYTATPEQIKKAYRQLVKVYHPDSQTKSSNHDHTTKLNHAYEVLSDPKLRSLYDQEISCVPSNKRQERSADAQQYYQNQRQQQRYSDVEQEVWLAKVYTPINHLVNPILNSLHEEIEQLSADPFDEELMEIFGKYLHRCKNYLQQAQKILRSKPNPSNLAKAAASVYHCLNQIGDGIEELERFTFTYDDYYLHTGKELFTIAKGLSKEARYYVNAPK